MAQHHAIELLWIDALDQLSSQDLAAFSQRGIGVTQVDFTDLENEHFLNAQVAVLNLSSDTTMLKEIQVRIAGMGSSLQIIARVARDDLALGIKAMHNGALSVVPNTSYDPVEWAAVLDMVHIEPKKCKSAQTFVFADPVSRNLLALAERVANVDVSVLIVGPTGAGKEVLARILHDASPRHMGPFVAFNCAAMPENLIEDMLFGHEKGSFTGATKVQPGLFEQAQGGTVFLDEIGEMSFHLQAKLLRILQERAVVRLGGQKLIDLDIRIVAATNRDLKAAIAQNIFREDLYFRLSAFKLSIPSLIDRPLDILPLAEQFLKQQSNGAQPPRLTSAAQHSLETYSWPGNVRELQNVLIRSIVLSNGAVIDTQHLMFDDFAQPEILHRHTTHAPSQSGWQHNALPRAQVSAASLGSHSTVARERGVSEDLTTAIKHSECQTIMAALHASRSREQAAEQLGISARTLRHKLQRLREQGINVTRAYAR